MNGLKLENQLCFPLYACAKEIVKKYKPMLDEIDLTYTQYITMMVLWEHKEINVKSLGEYLYLDSGTLTPVLKKLESKKYITRKRSAEDERNLMITITQVGEELAKKAMDIPEKIGKCVELDPLKAQTLYHTLYEVLGNIAEDKAE
ncbi:MAG: MarR family transcriptional regulator [Clostridiales bacterium]|nr:MarR family transcriptional regulator [Clostridiales bacterium]